MSVDKLVDSAQLDSDLTSVANAIRAKTGGSSQLAFPSGFVSAISGISPSQPSLQNKTVTPTTSQQTVQCDSGYDGLDTVTVNQIPSQYIVPSGTKSITANGSGIDVSQYADADVAVPNSYAAGDEGKVVSSGALVSQSSDSTTANGTFDTTLINSFTVNVSGSDPSHLKTGVDICLVMGAANWESNKAACNLSGSNANSRRSAYTLSGSTLVYYATNSYSQSDLHLIPIPSGATKVKITVDRSMQFAVREYYELNGSITDSVGTTGWESCTANTASTVNLTSGTSYLTVVFRVNSSSSNFTYSTIPRKVLLDFE